MTRQGDEAMNQQGGRNMILRETAVRRMWGAAVAVWLPVGVTAVTWSLWSDRLPGRIARHWSGSGAADGFSGTGEFAAGVLALAVAAGVTGLVAVALVRRTGWGGAGVAGTGVASGAGGGADVADRAAAGADVAGAADGGADVAGAADGGADVAGAADGGADVAGAADGGADVAEKADGGAVVASGADGGGAGGAEAELARGEAAEAVARRVSAARFALVVAGSVAGGAAGVWVSTATATLADPGDPRLGWRFAWFVAGMAWGLVVDVIAGPLPRFPASQRPVAGALELGPTERAAFSTTLRSPLLTGGLVATTAALGVGALAAVPALGVAAAGIGILALFSARFRVTADRRGLRLVAGIPGVTLRHIPLADIARAETIELDPVKWGGWGYRVFPGRTALVLRAGPALVLDLRDGRRFAVTLDRPEVPAALLNGLQARALS